MTLALNHMLAGKRTGKTAAIVWMALRVMLGLMLASAMWVGAYRWVDPARNTTGQWRPLADIPASLQTAVVLAEDARFCTHRGVDWISVNGALARARAGERLVGASTLTQQVAKNVFLWSDRSWVRKGVELWFTFLIEAMWSKSRILEVYLNEAQWGAQMYGADAALRAPGMPASALEVPPVLDLFEASKLAVMLPSPVRYREKLPDAQDQKRFTLASMMMNPAIENTMRCIQ